jgi:hypothetical protein
LPEQDTWQVTPNPPQLMRLLQDFVPEQVSTVLVAPAPGLSLQEPSPLQLTAHSVPPQFDPEAQLFVPPQAIVVLGASLWMFQLHASDPEHSILQLSPPQLM